MGVCYETRISTNDRHLFLYLQVKRIASSVMWEWLHMGFSPTNIRTIFPRLQITHQHWYFYFLGDFNEKWKKKCSCLNNKYTLLQLGPSGETKWVSTVSHQHFFSLANPPDCAAKKTIRWVLCFTNAIPKMTVSFHGLVKFYFEIQYHLPQTSFRGLFYWW